MNMNVTRRHAAILESVAQNRITSQNELLKMLVDKGFIVTQATLSRDLQVLGIGKMPYKGRSVYVLPLVDIVPQESSASEAIG